MPAELEQSKGRLGAPGEEGRVAAVALLETTTGLEHLLEPADQVAAQNAQTRPALGEKVQARSVGKGFAHAGAGQRRRGIVELALLQQGVGEKSRRVPREASRGRPRLAGGEGLARIDFRLRQVASQHQGHRAKDFRRSEGEGRPAPVCLGECLLVDRQNLVTIRERQHGAWRDEGCGEDLFPQERSAGERTAGERDRHSGRRSSPGVTKGELREQKLRPNCLLRGSAPDVLEPLESLVAERQDGPLVVDEPALQEALELGVGPCKLIQRVCKTASAFTAE